MLRRLAQFNSLNKRCHRHLVAPPVCIRYNTNEAKALAKESATEGKTKNEDATLVTNNPLYEGPLAGIPPRLKIVSITTASGSMLGIPYLILTHTGDLGLAGQLAVGGAAMLAGTASTFVLNFFFSPYVHSLERIPVRKCQAKVDEDPELKAAQGYLIKATTRNLFCRKIEIVFDPSTEVSPYEGARPFANFVVKGTPLFVHGDMILDYKLRNQLLPEMKDDDAPQELSKNATDDFDRDDDDEISPLGR